MKKIAIGIQARSGSTRFPKKVFAKIGGKTVLQHVIDICNQTRGYINNYSHSSKTVCDVYVLCPFDDEIERVYSSKIRVIVGDENDVQSRYLTLAKESNADYIVRITSDCVLLPPFLITKLIKIAVMNKYDYVSNVDERFRTAPDGWDVEVFSKQMIEWAAANSKDKSDKEHVTTIMRRDPPPWANIGAVINFLDQSEFKISLDTELDLKNIERLYKSLKEKESLAHITLGEGRVHKF